MDAVEMGRALAGRHAERPAPNYDPDRSLLNYGEAPRQGDWTLRSALVRLAQPDPVRVGEILQAMRRLDATLHQVTKKLESHLAACDRRPTPDEIAAEPAVELADVRTADLARLVAVGVDGAGLMAGYEDHTPLDDEERLALPLLEIAARFETLSETLAAWADGGPADPPLEAVDEVRSWAWARMDELGVPVETGPPPGTRRRSG